MLAYYLNFLLAQQQKQLDLKMSDNKICKDCSLTKAESDFPKNKGVCKACIASKTKETKSKKEEEEAKEEKTEKKEKKEKKSPSKEKTEEKSEKKKSPSKESDEEKPKKKTEGTLAKKKKDLITEFGSLMAEPSGDAEYKLNILKFINKLTYYALNVE